MKIIALILVAAFLFSCTGKKKCTWSTVEDLDNADFIKCTPAPERDSTFIYMRHFSGGYNSMRQSKGIPLLPGNYFAEVYSVNNQVKWHGDYTKDGRFIEINKPYMKWKTLEWSGDTLKYDLSLFVVGGKDGYGDKLMNITYYLDTLNNRKDYLFEYLYFPGRDSKVILFTKAQADSVLKAWGLAK